MRIERVEVVGFGCLDRCRLDFTSGRANLILAPNEAGKSTLLAAIEIALYGFPSPRTREGRELREHYTPWAGGPSRVMLHLTDGNHTYDLEHAILDSAGNTIDRITIRRDQPCVILPRVVHPPADRSALHALGRARPRNRLQLAVRLRCGVQRRNAYPVQLLFLGPC